MRGVPRRCAVRRELASRSASYQFENANPPRTFANAVHGVARGGNGTKERSARILYRPLRTVRSLFGKESDVMAARRKKAKKKATRKKATRKKRK
jgi:hypothetical protein